MTKPSSTHEQKIYAIIGKSGVGKTQLIEGLISYFTSSLHKRVAALKFHGSMSVNLDTPGKDSYRFTQAGASSVMLCGNHSLYCTKTVDYEPKLSTLYPFIEDDDIVLIEGYKNFDVPTLVLYRQDHMPFSQFICDVVSTSKNIYACVSDIPPHDTQHYAQEISRQGTCCTVPLPMLDINNIKQVAEYIEGSHKVQK